MTGRLLWTVFLPLWCVGCGGGFERMQHQPRADAFERTPVFNDGAVMQRPPDGTVPANPPGERPAMSMALLAAGRRGFNTHCSPCHGIDGAAQTPVARHMTMRPPPPLISGPAAELSRDDVRQVIAQGYGLMPSYADVLAPDEQWAVAAYVDALRLSASTTIASLPAAFRLEAEAALGRSTP